MKKLLLLLSFLSTSVIVSPLRMPIFNIPILNICGLVGFVLGFILIHLFIKRYNESVKPKIVLLFAVLGASISQLPIIVINFIDTLGSLPDYLLMIVGIICGYYYSLSIDRHSRVITVVASTLFAILASTIGDILWHNYIWLPVQ